MNQLIKRIIAGMFFMGSVQATEYSPNTESIDGNSPAEESVAMEKTNNLEKAYHDEIEKKYQLACQDDYAIRDEDLVEIWAHKLDTSIDEIEKTPFLLDYIRRHAIHLLKQKNEDPEKISTLESLNPQGNIYLSWTFSDKVFLIHYWHASWKSDGNHIDILVETYNEVYGAMCIARKELIKSEIGAKGLTEQSILFNKNKFLKHVLGVKI